LLIFSTSSQYLSLLPLAFLIKSEPAATHRSIFAVKQVLILPLTHSYDTNFISLLEKGFRDFPTFYSTEN